MEIGLHKKMAACCCLLLLIGLSAGCGQTRQPAEIGNLSPAVQKALAREDTPEAIDREFAKRMESQLQGARKLVQKDGDRILVKHKYGTTVMPKNPQRIVVLRLEDLTEALGVPVVGANYTPRTYLYDRLEQRGVPLLHVNDETKTVNYEEVQEAKPDLILLRDSFDQGVYEKLSRIAPVAAFNIRKEETALLALAMALGQEERGIARLEEFYGKAKVYRLGLHAAMGNGTTAFLRVMNREVRLYPYSRNDINRFMYDLLDLKPSPMVLAADQSRTNNAISLEWLPDLEADYLLVSTGYGASSGENGKIAEERYKKLQQDALWKSIPAVRQGHVHVVDTAVWNAHGIIAKELAMEEIYRTWGSAGTGLSRK